MSINDETPKARPSVHAASIAVAAERPMIRTRMAERSSTKGARRCAAVAFRRHAPGLGVIELVSNQLGLRLNQPVAAAVADRKEAAELVDDLVGVERDRARVVAHERAREDAGRPA